MVGSVIHRIKDPTVQGFEDKTRTLGFMLSKTGSHREVLSKGALRLVLGLKGSLELLYGEETAKAQEWKKGDQVGCFCCCLGKRRR